MTAPSRSQSEGEDALHRGVRGGNREFDEIIDALNAYSIVAITDRRGFIVHVNDRFCDISKYERHELIGQTHRIINSGRHSKEFFKEMWRVIGRGEVWNSEICNRAKDGTEYWVDTTIIPLLDDQCRPERYVAIRTEETQRHLAEEQVHRLAFSDNVTGLPNRASIVRSITADIDSKPCGELSGLVVISIDDLSAVNDAFGYEVGDRLLVSAAERLGRLGEGALNLARLDASTFGLLLKRLGTDETAAQTQAAAFIEQVLEAFSGETVLGEEIFIKASISIGYVMWMTPSHDTGAAGAPILSDSCIADGFIETTNPHEVLKSADIARKRARQGGGERRVRQFRRAMLDEAQQRVRLVSGLRRGIRSNELLLYTQPIVNGDRRMIGVEGLIRWINPEQGLLLPAAFIPLAEQTGLIVEIGEWVIEEACKMLAIWQRDPEMRELTFSVNLSERQLHVEGFADQVRSIVERHGVEPGRLKLELTESALQADLDRTIRLLSTLEAEGVSSALDDFGTGFSSLSYLQRLPVQQLKIDRSFVVAMGEEAAGASIVRTIVQLGRAFNLQVVAEGVETESQFEQLRELGVDAFQGFLFSKPKPSRELFEH